MTRFLFSIFMLFTGLARKLGVLRDFLLNNPLTNKIFFFIFRNLRPKKNVVIKIQGSKMLVDSRRGLGARVWENGTWEMMTTKIMQKYLKKGMVVVDIGANIGYYSLLAAKRVGPSGKVYAFEPAPENYAALKKNIEMNGYTNIIPVQKAVADKNGVVPFLLDVKEPLAHRIQDNGDKKNNIEVSVVTLDDFFKDKEKQIDIIKIDAEGSEMFVLEGMRRILTENKNLVVFSEFCPHLLEVSGVRPIDYLNKFTENDFKVYEIDEQKQVMKEADFNEITQTHNTDGAYKNTNIFCKRE